jgi:hypothetical protein
MRERTPVFWATGDTFLRVGERDIQIAKKYHFEVIWNASWAKSPTSGTLFV